LARERIQSLSAEKPVTPFICSKVKCRICPALPWKYGILLPLDWPQAALEPFNGVTDDPLAWAHKCVDEYGAEMLCLQMVSTDPNGQNRNADEAATTVKKLADAINVPIIVWGTANHEKDTEVLRRVCEICQDKKLIIGPVEEGDYKKIAAVAMGYRAYGYSQ